MQSDSGLHIGTAGGTLLSIAPSITSEDIIKTILLALVGAVVSFTVSLLLKVFTKSKKN